MWRRVLIVALVVGCGQPPQPAPARVLQVLPPGDPVTASWLDGDELVELVYPFGRVVWEPANGHLADSTPRTIGPDAVARPVAADGRWIAINAGEPRIVSREGTELARLALPHAVSTTVPCPGVTLDELVTYARSACSTLLPGPPGPRCPGRATDRTPMMNAAFAAWTGDDDVVPVARDPETTAFVGVIREGFVVWHDDGTISARLPASIASSSCALSTPPRCTLRVTSGGRYVLLHDDEETRVFDGTTGELRGRWTEPGVVAQVSEDQRVAVGFSLATREAVVLSFPELAVMRRLPGLGSVVLAAGWIVIDDLESHRVEIVRSNDGTLARDVAGEVRDAELGRFLVTTPRGALVLDAEDLSSLLTVEGEPRCTWREELVTCLDGHAAFTSWRDADSPPSTEVTALPCPHTCGDVVDTRAIIDLAVLGDGRFDLYRRADGAHLEIVLVAVGSEVEAVALNDESILGDAGGYALVRTADGQSFAAAPDRSQTIADWLDGP